MLKLLKKYNLILILAVLVLIFGILNPAFLKLSNLLNILSQNSIIGIVSLGMTLVIIIGGIDLSVGSTVAVTGILLALLISIGQPLVVAIIICLIFGALIGYINGILVVKARIPAFIVTLGIMSVARGGALLFSNSKSISISSSILNEIVISKIAGISVSTIIFVLLAVILWLFTTKTFWGKYLYAIGGNKKAAKFNGINISRFTLLAYLTCGLLCALAAILLVGSLNSAQPQAGQLYELTAIATVVIGGASLSGGKGSVTGTFLGVLILGVIENGLSINNVPEYYQYILIGIIIITSVLIDKNFNIRPYEK